MLSRWSRTVMSCRTVMFLIQNRIQFMDSVIQDSGANISIEEGTIETLSDASKDRAAETVKTASTTDSLLVLETPSQFGDFSHIPKCVVCTTPLHSQRLLNMPTNMLISELRLSSSSSTWLSTPRPHLLLLGDWFRSIRAQGPVLLGGMSVLGRTIL